MNTDQKFVNVLNAIGNLLGVTLLPSLDHEKQEVLFIISKFWLIFQIYSATCYVFYSLYVRCQNLEDRIFIIYRIMDLLEVFVEYLYFMLCIVWINFVHGNKWTEFMEKLSKIERYFVKDDNRYSCWRYFQFYACVIFSFAFFISAHFYRSYVVYCVVNIPEYAYFPLKLTYIFIVYATILLLIVLRALEEKYSLLSREIKRSFKSSYFEKKNYVEIKLKGFCKTYKHLATLVECLNVVFGWHLFFKVITTVIYTLNLITFVLLSNGGNTTSSTSVLNLLLMLPYWFGCFTVMTACGRVENKGKEIAEACFLLQNEIQDPELREEVGHFGNYAKNLTPKFSGAGFFMANQKLLATLIFSVTTYLVMIVQLNSSV